MKRIDGSDSLSVVVAPGGVGEYPRFIVEFEEVLVFSCFDESCAPRREWGDTEITEAKSCAWQWIDSPWIQSYEGCNYDASGNPIPLHHYLIFGGDNIVEVISRRVPAIEVTREPRRTETVFEF